jgi:hypothetical protein
MKAPQNFRLPSHSLNGYLVYSHCWRPCAAKTLDLA